MSEHDLSSLMWGLLAVAACGGEGRQAVAPAPSATPAVARMVGPVAQPTVEDAGPTTEIVDAPAPAPAAAVEPADAGGPDWLGRITSSDPERRRSQQRGTFVSSSIDRWRSAIENYVSSVTPGNQIVIGTAAVPFATYLNGMHNRIHPIFADTLLGSLDTLPPGHPLNDKRLVTRLEIVLTPDGRIERMGVVKSSGITMFDVAALDSVDHAQPFGPAPSAIVSADGHVYLQWEFHRDGIFACSTIGVRPFLLK